MNDFIKKYIAGKTYKDCLIPDNKEYLIQIKKGILNVDKAVELAIKTDNETKEIKNKYLKEEEKINKKAIETLDYVKFEILKRKFKKELLK